MPPLSGDPSAHDPSEFSSSLSGSCLCGSITVTITDSELFTKRRGHLCYCSNCRKVAGSYVSSNLLIEAEKVRIEDANGTMRVYDDKATGSGGTVHRAFCSVDGNPVKSETSAYPGKIILKMGMMPRIPEPESEGFGLHRHPWQGKNPGTDVYEIKWAGPERKKMES